VESTDLDGYAYRAVKAHAQDLIRDTLAGLMTSEGLAAIVYPTSSQPALNWLMLRITPFEIDMKLERGTHVSSSTMLAVI